MQAQIGLCSCTHITMCISLFLSLSSFPHFYGSMVISLFLCQLLELVKYFASRKIFFEAESKQYFSEIFWNCVSRDKGARTLLRCIANHRVLPNKCHRSFHRRWSLLCVAISSPPQCRVRVSLSFFTSHHLWFSCPCYWSLNFCFHRRWVSEYFLLPRCGCIFISCADQISCEFFSELTSTTQIFHCVISLKRSWILYKVQCQCSGRFIFGYRAWPVCVLHLENGSWKNE